MRPRHILPYPDKRPTACSIWPTFTCSKTTPTPPSVLHKRPDNEALTKPSAAKRNETRNKLQFYRLLACTIGLLALLLMLLYRSRLKKLRLAQQLRNQQFQTMEESLRRKEAEISLAQQEEELQRQQIRQLQQNLDYYKQLNRITLPVLMRRQNSQGALHLTDDDWDIIIQNADACFNHSSRRLRHHCPQLTDDDVRFCCLVKMNLPLTQLAEIYHIAKGSISRRKMRLKEKMNIAGRSFDEFLADF